MKAAIANAVGEQGLSCAACGDFTAPGLLDWTSYDYSTDQGTYVRCLPCSLSIEKGVRLKLYVSAMSAIEELTTSTDLARSM